MSQQNHNNENDAEFLWLMSLSDLMILLFVFFVVLFSFSYKKVSSADMKKMNSVIKGEKIENSLDAVQTKLLKWVVDKKLLEDIEINQKEDSLIIQIKEKVLFPIGSFTLKDESFEILSLIGQALTKIPTPYRIGIEGHTDGTSMNEEKFDGNWQLSSLRALNVLKAFNFSQTTNKRVVLLAYGSQRPLVPNFTKEGKPIPTNQAKNRRVTIRIF